MPSGHSQTQNGLEQGLDLFGCQAIQNPAAMTILLSQAKSCRVKMVNFNKDKKENRKKKENLNWMNISKSYGSGRKVNDVHKTVDGAWLVSQPSCRD